MNPPMFLETFLVADGQLVDFATHHRRMLHTLAAHGISNSYLENFDLHAACPIPCSGRMKGRMVYGERITEITFAAYQPKPVQCLHVVDAPSLSYAYKYADRKPFADLLSAVGNHADVWIVQHGFLTDTSYSNAVLFDGKDYVTPHTFLLNGTQRQRLLQRGVIREMPLRIADLKDFQMVYLINALLDWEHKTPVPISRILY